MSDIASALRSAEAEVKQLRADRDRLAAELARLNEHLPCGHRKADMDNSYGDCILCITAKGLHEFEADNERLEAELSAARADAERLDYVEKSGREVMNWTFKGVLHWGVDRIGFDDIKWEPILRAAIDAARATDSAGGTSDA